MNATQPTAPAYDYDAQKWLKDTAAAEENARQIRSTLELLHSASGQAYCDFISCPSKAEFVAQLEADLAMIEDPAPVSIAV